MILEISAVIAVLFILVIIFVMYPRYKPKNLTPHRYRGFPHPGFHNDAPNKLPSDIQKVKTPHDPAENNHASLSHYFSFISPKRNALPGSFDESVFRDPVTGHFKFPEYVHDERFKIQITDHTNYKKIYGWLFLSRKRKRNFSISDYENSFKPPDIDVDPFDTLFHFVGEDELEGLEFLKDAAEEIEEMMLEHKEAGYVITKNAFRQDLCEKGFLDPYHFTSLEKRRWFEQRYLSTMNIHELRECCHHAEIKTKIAVKLLNRNELITNILESNKGTAIIGPNVRPCVFNAKFTQLLDTLYDFYINDIAENLCRFHPLYLPYIWNEILTGVDEETHPKLKSKVRDILKSKYWEDLLV